MLHAIQALDEICDACTQDRPLPAHLRQWVAQSISKFLEHDCENLNEAFGIHQGHGGIPWWREKAIRTRDEAIRELARAHLSSATTSRRAREIHCLAQRYAGTSWPRDRLRNEMPAAYADTAKQYLWLAFKSGAKMPVSDRHLRSVLAGLEGIS